MPAERISTGRAEREAVIAVLVRALEEARAGYKPKPEMGDFYLGIMHGLSHAIDIVRRHGWRISTGRAAQRVIMRLLVILAALTAAFLWGAVADHLGYLGP